MDLIDLRARTTQATVLQSVARAVGVVVVFGCLLAVYQGSDSPGVRIAMGVFAFVMIALVLYVAWNRNRMIRWVAVDHEGIRLLDRRRRDHARFAWGDLAGAGLMTNEAARRRHMMAASLRSSDVVRRALVSVPIWLELWPASPDAVSRQPQLRAAWELGRKECWRIWLSDGLGQTFALGESVARHRPELWRGQREGSALFG